MHKVKVLKAKAVTEWAKHLRPWKKRQVNKSIRRYGKYISRVESE